MSDAMKNGILIPEDKRPQVEQELNKDLDPEDFAIEETGTGKIIVFIFNPEIALIYQMKYV